MVREILVDWTTASGAGKVSVFNFLDATPVADQRSALATFLTAADAICHSSSTWVIRPIGREMDTVTGTLTGEWQDSTSYVGAGGVATGGPEADAVQALVRWSTGNIVGGRFLKGRTFLPGVAQGAVTNGNLGTTSVVAVTAAADGLATAAVQFAVWHRPTNGSGGAAWAVDSGSCWSELAVLRRRRG